MACMTSLYNGVLSLSWANWRGSVCTSPHLSRLRAGRLAQVSHLWRDVTASDLLWRPLWEAQYQRPLTEQEEAAVGAGCSFKRLFAEAQVGSTSEKHLAVPTSLPQA